MKGCFSWVFGRSRRRTETATATATGIELGTRTGTRNQGGHSSQPPPGGTPDRRDAVRTFSYQDLVTATSNFSEDNCLGQGGFGKVYKGYLCKIDQTVAIKKLNKSGYQGGRQFVNEVVTLSRAKHPNLVTLIGYCSEDGQKLLVYEYMPLRSLDYHLHNPLVAGRPLDWNTRMKIALGTAKGLHYLHAESSPPIIYRDMKSSNILLDSDYNPKLSDFGLAEARTDSEETHIASTVWGTEGYMAPEYGRTGKLTLNSDVYSFGVVLLELISGRLAHDEARKPPERHLTAWARLMLDDLENASLTADPILEGQYPRQGLNNLLGVCAMCIQRYPDKRPDIGQVVRALTFLASGMYVPSQESVVAEQRIPSSRYSF